MGLVLCRRLVSRRIAMSTEIIVSGSAAHFEQLIVARTHRLVGDEPLADGGGDAGPTPYEFLLAALGSCTSMTLGWYARSKAWPLESVEVRLRHSRRHEADCVDCEEKAPMLDHIDRDIELRGNLTPEQRARLIEVANKCPVHRTLTSKIVIETREVGPAISQQR